MSTSPLHLISSSVQLYIHLIFFATAYWLLWMGTRICGLDDRAVYSIVSYRILLVRMVGVICVGYREKEDIQPTWTIIDTTPYTVQYVQCFPQARASDLVLSTQLLQYPCASAMAL